jgi:hypothetical protein
MYNLWSRAQEYNLINAKFNCWLVLIYVHNIWCRRLPEPHKKSTEIIE